MTIKTFLNSVANTGVEKKYKPWEVYLTRKLNLSSSIGIFNVSTTLLIFLWIGYNDSFFELSTVLYAAPFIFFLNKRFGYVPALYLFTLIGCFLFYFLSVKLGRESFAFLFYFPFSIVVIQMAARKEIFWHLVGQVLLCAASLIAVLVSYHYNLVEAKLPVELVEIVKYVVMFFSFAISIGYILIISTESAQQEEQLKTALQQKEVLLAELFHRVKNNLNIVTSVLNLKKNASTSYETQKALEECRTLVFSMALVHSKIYNTNSLESINFRDYLGELVPELINTVGGVDAVDFDMYSPSLNLSLSQAIPCGLIVNELITNAFKHGRMPERKLKIRISIKEENNTVMLELGDNGPGLPKQEKPSGSLGMDLIESLVEQLGGEYAFHNTDGLQFNLRFNQ